MLLNLFRSFLFPNGDASARVMEAIRTKQKGQMRASPGARWMPFVAVEITDTGTSAFRWEARIGSGAFTRTSVTDAYEHGHGRLVVSLGGLVPIKKLVGPEFDIGELQRYLGAICWLAPVASNHESLEWEAAGSATLRVRDRLGPRAAWVDFELGPDGRPIACRAERPRTAGNRSVMTPWSARASGFELWEGFRVARRLEASWELPEGTFNYYRSDVTSFEAVPSLSES